jgi:hypothetical protein
VNSFTGLLFVRILFFCLRTLAAEEATAEEIGQQD